MKLSRFKKDGAERVGLVKGDRVHEVAGYSFRESLGLMTDGDDLKTSNSYDLSDVNFLPPTTRSNVTFGIGLNYPPDDSQVKYPDDQILVFQMPYRSLVGHGQHIIKNTRITDYLFLEGELGVVIGKEGRNIPKGNSSDFISGYTIFNDITAGDMQYINIDDEEFLDWFTVNSMQSTSSAGPWVTSASELSDLDDLHITSRRNGDVLQDADVQLINDIDEIVTYLSERVRLEPGDLIATGTPWGDDFKVSLENGDTTEIEISGLGSLSNKIKEVP